MAVVRKIPLDQITVPDWSVRRPITESLRYKLRISVNRFGPGLLTTRGKDFELLDGAKRYAVLKEQGTSLVHVNHFPTLSDLDTLILIRNLHYEWSPLDILEFAELLSLATDISSVDSLANIMPEDRETVKGIFTMLDFDWSQYEDKDDGFVFL